MEELGWQGVAWMAGILLAVCAFPQALASFRQKHSHGITHGMLFLWFVGEILGTCYTFHLRDWALFSNYACNVIVIGIIYYYKLWPKNESKSFK